MTDHDELARWDAAYVLGALAPADRQEFEAHLAGCETCRASVAELAPMPGLLTRAKPLVSLPEAEEAPVGPPADLIARVEAKAHRSRRLSTRIVLVAASVAAVVALAIGIPAALDDGPAPAAVVALEGTAAMPISASVELDPVPWGTRLSMTCDYPAPDRRYRGEAPGTLALVVTDDTGATSQVSTWAAVPGREIHLDAATAVPLERIARLEIRTEDGATVLAADLTG